MRWEYTDGMLRNMGNDVGIYRRNAEGGGMMWEHPEGMLRKGERCGNIQKE